MSATASLSRSASSHAPFDSIAERYDETFTDSLIGRAQRKRVWQELDRVFVAGQRILEINCGTGVDAVHLAGEGVEVWACDNSSRMLEVARRRVASSRLAADIHLYPLATEEIQSLQHAAPFDGAFSNFGGLNCVANIAAVARSFASLLRPGAPVVLCVMGRYVAWEIGWFVLQGRLGEAFRRLGRQPVQVRLGDDSIACWYRSVRVLRRAFWPFFRLRRWRGVGISVPPSYLERQARHFPGIMKILERADPYLGRTPLVRSLADHLLLTFQRS
jgi:ubiquinone/menaquinone biosynthesis C-methylase UbiE